MRREPNTVRLLAIASFAAVIATTSTASSGLPSHRAKLEAALTDIAGLPDRPRVAPGRTLREGDIDDRVRDLRDALAGVGIVATLDEAAADATFDAGLKDAVLAFQRRIGLIPDGIAGPATLRALNDYAEVVSKRLLQALSLPDWATTGRHVYVNIAAAETYAVEDGVILLRSRSIVGTPRTRTPSFSHPASAITLNPTWTVPPGIAARKYDGRSFVMPPGPRNPLGTLRIDMPNRHLVFLHGTDDPSLFDRDIRAFSSGCVRVEDIVPLARWLIGEGLWEEARADERLEGWRTYRIGLPDAVPVSLEYRLASVTQEGEVVYHPDIYGLLSSPVRPRTAVQVEGRTEQETKAGQKHW